MSISPCPVDIMAREGSFMCGEFTDYWTMTAVVPGTSECSTRTMAVDEYFSQPGMKVSPCGAVTCEQHHTAHVDDPSQARVS